MSKVFELAFKLGAELSSSFQRSFADAQRSMAGLQKSADTLNSVGKTLSVGVTAPVLGLGAAALKIGSEFEASMSEVAAISGATGKDLQALEDKAREMGSTTKYSASEAAQALKFMSLAGWDSEKSISAIGGVLNLAAASGMELAAASDLVTDYMSAFGIEAEKSGYFADVMAYAQKNANTSVVQLGDAFKNTAAVMNAGGQDVETTTAFLAMMANQGFKGAEAGTALTAIMRDMTAKMKNGAVAIGKTNVQVMDAQGNYRDLTDILTDVSKATNGMGDAERATALSSTFTADSIKGLNLILNAGVDEAAKFEDGLRGSAGTADEMAAVMNDNLQGRIKSMQSALEEVAIVIYQNIQPALEKGVAFIQNLADKFNGLTPAMQNTIIVLGVTAAAIGPVLVAMSVLIKSFMTVRSAIAGVRGALAGLKLVMMANPILLVVGALAALAAGLYFAYQKSETFRNVINPLLDVLKNVFVSGVSQIGSTVSEILPKVIEAFKSLATPIKNLGAMVLPLLISAAEKVFPTLVMIVETAAPIIKSLISSLAEIFTNGIIPAIKSLLSIVEAVFPIIQFVIENALTLITGIIQAAMALLQGDWSGAWEIIKETATTIMDNIVSFFSNINLYDIGVAVINGLIEGIKSMGGAVLGAIGNLVPEPIKGVASKLLKNLPGFAEGGIVGNPTLAWIGEGGDTEAVIPWNNSQRSKDLWLQTGQQLGMLKDNGVFDNMQHQVSMQMQANESPAISPGQVAQSVPNQNNSNVIQLTYNPQYNVQRPEDLEQVKQHADKDKDDLEARIAEFDRDKRRKSFGD
ncbi:phage tail tape measure protein [Lysinibacillus sp. NPDC047702]|uniref:phage tail tape measure protein n=1 Tax=unclassified Lysinibacillus TaxID=2636778 RepID=UPI003CFED464